MTIIPGVDMSAIYDGRTLGSSWEYYTVNVKLLGTLSHEQFVRERPNAAREIERACKILEKLGRLVEE